MESSRHIVCNIDRSLEYCAHHPRETFLGITSEVLGFFIGIGSSRGIANTGDDERVISCAKADCAYGSEGGGYDTCNGIGWALVVEVFSGFVSVGVRIENRQSEEEYEQSEIFVLQYP
jgi:hypothetical protein